MGRIEREGGEGRLDLAHQATGFDNFATGIGRGNPIVRRERSKLDVPTEPTPCSLPPTPSLSAGSFPRHSARASAG
jgi:hypothetical protein